MQFDGWEFNSKCLLFNYCLTFAKPDWLSLDHPFGINIIYFYININTKNNTIQQNNLELTVELQWTYSFRNSLTYSLDQHDKVH